MDSAINMCVCQCVLCTQYTTATVLQPSWSCQEQRWADHLTPSGPAQTFTVNTHYRETAVNNEDHFLTVTLEKLLSCVQSLTFWPKGSSRRKPTWSVMERVDLHRFLPSAYFYLYYFIMCPCYTPSFMACFPQQLFLSSSAPSFPLTFSFHSSLSAFIFFHDFIPFFTSSSLSLLFLSLLPLRLLVSLPKTRRPVRSHPLPRKQGLKFKAAVVDWQQEREHRRRPGLGQNRFKYCLK